MQKSNRGTRERYFWKCIMPNRLICYIYLTRSLVKCFHYPVLIFCDMQINSPDYPRTDMQINNLLRTSSIKSSWAKPSTIPFPQGVVVTEVIRKLFLSLLTQNIKPYHTVERLSSLCLHFAPILPCVISCHIEDNQSCFVIRINFKTCFIVIKHDRVIWR